VFHEANSVDFVILACVVFVWQQSETVGWTDRWTRSDKTSALQAICWRSEKN